MPIGSDPPGGTGSPAGAVHGDTAPPVGSARGDAVPLLGSACGDAVPLLGSARGGRVPFSGSVRGGRVPSPGSAHGGRRAAVPPWTYFIGSAVFHYLGPSRFPSGIDGLAAAMLVAAVCVLPLGAWQAVPALADPVALAAGIGVGVASSVIPYVCDQLAMARMARATYALLVALLPATATVIGALVLRQIPAPAEAAGVALVITGVALHRERR
ncbi:EamA family transporter [Actinoallomurus rhizosphaericola]|uniref:EamA family transporter n=1 Tax=Actinoallomurus rhizosphaericola TaxID=2952536 RepID=UPI002092C535|nr:EamA family transporter [Actinoallomurus rhizosphaericola]MCO5998849.1 EamA family transporter [Actinoallomurus rhizosphaericola]